MLCYVRNIILARVFRTNLFVMLFCYILRKVYEVTYQYINLQFWIKCKFIFSLYSLKFHCLNFSLSIIGLYIRDQCRHVRFMHYFFIPWYTILRPSQSNYTFFHNVFFQKPFPQCVKMSICLKEKVKVQFSRKWIRIHQPFLKTFLVLFFRVHI